jgi:hypothetical protein
MPMYRNADGARRWWPGLSAPDGSTLDLEPGGTVTFAKAVDAPFLELVPAPKPKPKPKPATTVAPAAPAPAAVDPANISTTSPATTVGAAPPAK